MQPYFDPTRKTTSKIEDDLKKKLKLKTTSKKIETTSKTKQKNKKIKTTSTKNKKLRRPTNIFFINEDYLNKKEEKKTTSKINKNEDNVKF
jgi:hypothetical protein